MDRSFFLLSSFSVTAFVIILTAGVFIISLRGSSSKAPYKKWLLLYAYGLLLWHGMGFISGGLYDEYREFTYRYTNTLFNLGFCIAIYGLVQIAYLFPRSSFERERKAISYVAFLVSLAYWGAIFWYHFLADQQGHTSSNYGSFVNPLAGIYSFLLNIWILLVFIRKARYFKRQGSKDEIPVKFLAICSFFTLAISVLFIYPGASHPIVLPTYIYGVWIILQIKILIFIIYSVFPIRFESRLVGFTFASVMAILTVVVMVIFPFTTNSEDPGNIAQRIQDQQNLINILLIISGATAFILWIFPRILRVNFIEPLDNLMEGISTAESGNLDVEVPFRMLDEIGIVTRNFNSMVKSLSSSKRKLTEYAGTLEHRVSDRTAELQKSIDDLRTTQAQLIQAEKMASLGELTAGIAHEIQNPLNFVNNFSEVNKELIEELKEAIGLGHVEEVHLILADLAENEGKVAHHGKRAEQIVKSMLQHSRSSAGEKELIDLNALCDEYVRLAYHGIRAREKSFSAQFELKLDPHLPQLEVVPQDIGRVVLNLVNNAFQAIAAQEDGKVIVGTHHDDHGIYISVKDNGPGIDAEIKDKIFQPFFTTKPTGQGTGLGLSMSYDIVTKGHGGTLKVKSSGSEGTEFMVFLPK